MSHSIPLSKSRLLAYRQCPRRLWLEIHRKDLLQFTAQQKPRFDAGHRVGELARELADPQGTGVLFDAQRDGFGAVIRETQRLLAERRPMFEAAFVTKGAIALVDLLLPEPPEASSTDGASLSSHASTGRWRLVEVKSSGSVKAYHWDDLAVQVHILRAAGVELCSATVACVDTAWVYPGGGRYAGLLRHEEGLEQAVARDGEVRRWIEDGQAVAAQAQEPQITTGEHCKTPFECPFTAHCGQGQAQAVHPVDWLPRVQRRDLKDFLSQGSVTEMADVPDRLLNATQRRVKEVTISGTPWFDAQGAQRALAAHQGTLRFLDFEAAARAVPVWVGTRPYQQVPFQFSLHTLDEDGSVRHTEFIDLSGNDPTENFASQLVEACGDSGPVFVYNASFEGQVIDSLVRQIPDLAAALKALRRRLVDLKPITEANYYHPGQQGSWGLKSVLPTLGGGDDHSGLDGVADGQMAVDAYLEATDPDTPPERVRTLRQQLLKYCHLDTWAMVRLWAFLCSQATPPATRRTRT